MQTGPNKEKQKRTKKRIKDVFMKLYSKYPLEKISMRQVADLAGVTRSTVYVYFESVYDILEVIERELQEGMAKYFEQYSGEIKGENRQSWEESVEKWFEFCMENREYLVVILGPNGDPSFEYKLRKKLKKDLNQMMDDDGMKNDYLRKYALEYMAGAMISLVRYWLECNENLPAKDMAAVANVIRQTKGVLQDMDMSEGETEE